MTDIDLILSQLNADDSMIRIAAIKALQQVEDERVLSALKDMLADESIAVARTSVLVIGQLGSCDELPLLISLLEHESIWVRKAVVQSMGMTGCQDAVPYLVTLLGDAALDALAREALVALKVDPDFF